MSIVKTEQLMKVYGTGATAVTALSYLNINIRAGEFVAVMGPSGCGKSTLLHLLGGLDVPSAGEVALAGQELSKLAEARADLLAAISWSETAVNPLPHFYGVVQ